MGSGRGASRSSTNGPRAADVVGVPVLPPAVATAGVERMRSRIAALHRALVPPPVRILDAMLAPLDAAVLGAICRLGVPGAVRKTVRLDELASRLEVDPDRLTRLVRYAHTRGWVRLDRRGRVHPTRVTTFLRRDHPGGWLGWVDFAGDADVLGALAALAADPRAADPFAVANGASFFDWCAARPDRQAAFDAAMAAGGRMHGLVIAAALDWSGVRRVCDVGGGTGEVLATIAAGQPHITGVVVETPAVAAHFAASERVTVRSADAFEFAEPDCDRYLFVNVLHDWGDDDAERLLARVRNVAGAHAEVVVVEGERVRRPRPGVAVSSDVLMLALTPGGRERTTEELAAIAASAGWKHERRVALASGDYAHILSTARPGM